MIWRYDPIIFTETYPMEYHLQAFRQIADALKGYTNKCVISFVDIYAKNKRNMEALRHYESEESRLREFAKRLSEIAGMDGMAIAACAESMDLTDCGIEHNSCIDKNLIEDIIGCKLNVDRDKNQRRECGCVESIDIGTYNTCRNECVYCYANHSQESVVKNCSKYDPTSPLLCGTLTEEDRVSARKVQSCRDGQMWLFDAE